MSAKINGLEITALRRSALSSIAEERANRGDSFNRLLVFAGLTILALFMVGMFKILSLSDEVRSLRLRVYNVELHQQNINTSYGLESWE